MLRSYEVDCYAKTTLPDSDRNNTGGVSLFCEKRHLVHLPENGGIQPGDVKVYMHLYKHDFFWEEKCMY